MIVCTFARSEDELDQMSVQDTEIYRRIRPGVKRCMTGEDRFKNTRTKSVSRPNILVEPFQTAISCCGREHSAILSSRPEAACRTPCSAYPPVLASLVCQVGAKWEIYDRDAPTSACHWAETTQSINKRQRQSRRVEKLLGGLTEITPAADSATLLLVASSTLHSSFTLRHGVAVDCVEQRVAFSMNITDVSILETSALDNSRSKCRECRSLVLHALR